MEKEMIYGMFYRSLSKYNVRYVLHIGVGDAKVHSCLISHPPYPGVVVENLEDSNRFAKGMLNGIKKNETREQGSTFIGW